MTKLPLHTANKADDNFKKLAELFPNAVTETLIDGEVVRAIDKDILTQEISAHVVEGNEERYQFTWPDKKKSVLLANAPNYKTLRPCKEESVDFDNTENLYIEGDNLDVLKLLQETYLGKVKMIYIDPPYNTGKDFVYADDFKQSVDEYMDLTDQYDEDGNRLFTNSETNGRYHTDWLNMIYPRLKLAKDLLKDDGVIFISIDDNEVHNLRKVCDEVFGAWNFVSQLGWQKVYAPKNQARYFSNDYEFILCYCKNILNFKLSELPRTAEMNSRYKNIDNDPRGDWKAGDCVGSGERKNGYYDVISSTGKSFNVPQGKHWVYAPETMRKMIDDNRIWFGKDGSSFPAVKQFLTEVGGRKASNFLSHADYGHTDMAMKDIKKLFTDMDKAPFDTPKPIKLIEMLLRLKSDKNDIILDFFSGSATTAHAVMQLNAEDGGNRKFIMVQLPEEIDENNEAYKAGYRTICDIGKERIRRAGAKIKDEKGLDAQNLDIGFRVLKCDSTNMKDVYYSPNDVEQTQLDMFTSNIKEDRSPEDLLFQVMLDLGVFLSCKIKTEVIDGKNISIVYQGDIVYLIACFDAKISSDVVTTIAKRKPYYAVFRDSSMASDSLMASFEQIFEAYSKDTIRKVL